MDRDELVRQTLDKITSICWDLEPGVVKAEQNQVDARLVVASLQTLYRPNRIAQLPEFDFVIYDECHGAAAPANRSVLEQLGLFDGRTLGVGFTATMSRSDSYGLGDIWEDVVFERDVLWAIANGFLVDVRAESVTVNDLNLAEIARNHGDYQEGKLGDALIASGAADVVARAYKEKAGSRQGILFAPTVSSAQEFTRAFNAAGISTATIIGKTPTEERQRLFEEYRQRRIQVLSGVTVLCVDEKTEVLTDSGWTGIDEMSYEHRVANWNFDGTVYFETPEKIYRRERHPDERMVVCESQTRNFRVTEGHEMIYRHSGWSWKKKTAGELVGSVNTGLPVTGLAEPCEDKKPSQYDKTPVEISRLVAGTAYNLRKFNGFGRDESLREARRRTEERYTMLRKNPEDLTLDECRFIGFWLGDGSVGKNKSSGATVYTASQSTTYPEIIRWFDKVVESLGVDATRYEISSDSDHVRWLFPRGTGGGGQKRNGIFHLEPYLNKDGTDLFFGLNENQFDALIEGLWYADGDHRKAENGRPGSGFRIYSCNYGFLSILQAVACVRGWRTSVSMQTRFRRNPRHRNLYYMSFRRSPTSWGGGKLESAPRFEDGWVEERVWCVETRSNNIITRRNGKVTVMGNCVGFDMPQAEVAVMARPTTNPGFFIQCVGRVLRPHPKKDSALVLDVVGATGGKSLASICDLSRTEVVPAEGESLAEALVRSEDEAANVERDVIAGKATYATVNLFKGSDAAWLRTHGGTWFIPTKRCLVVLKPQEDGKFRVARTHSNYRAGGEDAAWLTDRAMSLDLAIAWGEQLAIEIDPVVADRSRDWRKNRRTPTKQQKEHATRLGLKFHPKIRKNELSDLISVHHASRMLDPRK